MNAFLQAALTFIEQNTALVFSWIVIFQVILVLCVLWLAYRVRATPNALTLERAEEAKQKVHAVSAKMDNLDTYIREQFSKDFNGAMKSFDDTATSVLGQMKDELIQGVQRIDQIQTAVSKKTLLEERVNQGQQDVRNLITAPDERLVDEPPANVSDEKPTPDVTEKETASVS